MPRWYEDDDTYLSQRFPTFFGGADVYSEVSPYDDLDDYGFRRSKIGPVQRGPKPARIGPATPKPPAREQSPWYERLGGAMGIGYPNQPVTTPPFVPMDRRPATIGPTAGLNRRLPAGNYPDENIPQVRPTRIGPAQGGMLTTRSAQPEYSGNPVVNAMVAARANSTGANAPLREPSIYGEGVQRIPNAMRIAMENARANSNRPGRPPVFQAQGVTDPTSVNVNGRYNIGFNPQSYPAATRVAAAARPRPMGVPSGVPIGPPSGGLTAPPESPIQIAPQNSPYESPIGETGWTERAPAPFMGPNAQGGLGAWNKFDITAEPGRNAGAEGNFPGTVRGQSEQSGSQSAQENPYLEGSTRYNWDPIQRYNEYLAKEPARQDFKPGGWARLLNAASAGVHGYQTGDIGAGVALGRSLNDRPYEEAIESWKRRGTGLARAAELEDKRYNIAVQDENRRADNYRQQQELDLRRQTHLLNDEKFRHELTMDEWKMLQEGWKTQVGDNGTMIMFRPGANGEMEYRNTRVPNDKYTAAQQRAEDLAGRESAERRTRTSAGATIQAARIGAESRAAEGEKSRAHQSTENLLGRQNRLAVTREGKGVTGGTDYVSPVKLLGSPNFKELEQSGYVQLRPDPNTQGSYVASYASADPAKEQSELERLAGGDGAKYRKLALQLAQFREYMASLEGM